MPDPISPTPDNRPAGWATMSPAISDANRYYEWTLSRIQPFLGKNILDIGSGYGIHLAPIIPQVEKLTSIDLSAESVEFLARRFAAYGGYRAVQADFGLNPLPAWMVEASFDTILCLNVLEHIEDDLAALRQMRAILHANRGTVVLQIPAHPGLYGSMDRQAGHFRRYRKVEIGEKLEKAGFTVLRLEYFNRLSALFWWINGRVLNKALDSGGVNSQIQIYDRYLVPILKPLESALPLPFGQSILAAAKVNDDGNA
jgi:SAM-dependent methyltransferase